MKIIVLDIDGVLNSHKFLYDEGGFERQKKIENGRQYKALDPEYKWYKAMLDPNAVRCLQTVIQITGAKVVISSSWRLGMELQTLIDIFKSYGNDPAPIEIIGRTPCCHSDFEYEENFSDANYRDIEDSNNNRRYDERAQEIQLWLDRNKKKLGIKEYVVIDDSADAGEGPHKDRFVKTKWETGMLDEHIDEMIRILL